MEIRIQVKKTKPQKDDFGIFFELVKTSEIANTHSFPGRKNCFAWSFFAKPHNPHFLKESL